MCLWRQKQSYTVHRKDMETIIPQKNLFGIWGQYFYRRPKSLGFKLHEDYIDYSFDEISDPNERFDAYYTQVKQLTEFRIDDLIERTVWEREENRNNCFPHHGCRCPRRIGIRWKTTNRISQDVL